MPSPSTERVTTYVGDSSIVTLVHGGGPAIVVLPSYGRDGGLEYDDFAARAAGQGWCVLRPQPRGALGSVGSMQGVSFRELAADVAGVMGALVDGPTVLVGHAFGNLLSRMVTTEHPDLIRAVAIVASQSREVPERIARTPFIVGDPTRPTHERLAVLEEASSHRVMMPACGWTAGIRRLWPCNVLRLRACHCRSTGAAVRFRCLR